MLNTFPIIEDYIIDLKTHFYVEWVSYNWRLDHCLGSLWLMKTIAPNFTRLLLIIF